jgi:dTDP-4-amino-4,6-dideoxygalactose transaminase
MSRSEIPFNRPVMVGSEQAYMLDALQRGHISGDGYFAQRCERLLEEGLHVPKALLVTSCTHALEMAALLLDIGPGAEVIVPSFTFVSTVNAFVLRGATPVFIDIRRDTLNLDETQLEALLTPRTRAIVPVHYAGVSCEMDAVLASARQHGTPVVEDNAHGLFGSYKGKYLGTFGCLAAQSFHETKNFSCGEGGALLINDPRYLERAQVIRDKGTNRRQLLRGLVDKYTWVDLGSSYVLSDLLAAYLYAQLERRDEVQTRRRQIWDFYAEQLQGWAADHGVRMPIVPASCQHSYHLFYLLLPSLQARQGLLAHLRAQGIHGVFHYQPLHLSRMGRQFGGREGMCPVTEEVSERLIRLPFYFSLTDADQTRVVEAIREFDAH